MTLNGKDLRASDLCRDGHVELPCLADQNSLVVEATSIFSETGTGLQRVGDADDPQACVFGKGNNGGVSQMFCCFDQPDLRAPINLTVRTPSKWCCRANLPSTNRTDGKTSQWRFATTPPLAPYLVALCAGSDHVLATAAYGSVPITVSTPTAPSELYRADVIVDLVCNSLEYYGRVLRAPYPFPKCDLVFVPELRPLAYSPPGISLLQDRLLEPTDDPAISLACVIAHEVAHAWFGGIVDLRFDDEQWLQEALATYISRTALETIRPGCAPWDPAVSACLPDDAYAKDAALMRQLEVIIGRESVLNGLAASMRRHWFATVTLADLVDSWSEVSGNDLTDWVVSLCDLRGRDAT